MKSDIFEFTVLIENRCATFLVLALLFLFAAFLLSCFLKSMAGMVCEKDERGIEAGANMKLKTGVKPTSANPGITIQDDLVTPPEAATPLTGKGIKLIMLTLAHNGAKFKEIILSMPHSSIDLLKRWLRLDYIFMACIYPAMFFISRWLVNCSLVSGGFLYFFVSAWCGYLPFIVWGLDIVENRLTSNAIEQALRKAEWCEIVKPPVIFWLRVISGLKWLGALLYTIPVVLLLLHHLVNWISNS